MLTTRRLTAEVGDCEHLLSEAHMGVQGAVVCCFRVHQAQMRYSLERKKEGEGERWVWGQRTERVCVHRV